MILNFNIFQSKLNLEKVPVEPGNYIELANWKHPREKPQIITKAKENVLLSLFFVEMLFA